MSEYCQGFMLSVLWDWIAWVGWLKDKCWKYLLDLCLKKFSPAVLLNTEVGRGVFFWLKPNTRSPDYIQVHFFLCSAIYSEFLVEPERLHNEVWSLLKEAIIILTNDPNLSLACLVFKCGSLPKSWCVTKWLRGRWLLPHTAGKWRTA